MTSRNTDMQVIFNKLTERNKDILILVAGGIMAAQEVPLSHANHRDNKLKVSKGCVYNDK